MFDNNLENVDRFSKFFTRWFVRKFSMYLYKYFHLTCNMLLHYLVKFENPKFLPNFHVERDI